MLLREEIKENLLELEMHRAHGYCLFGFNNKLICNKFEREMQKYLPHFVLISRRLVEVPPNLKAEKEYYDGRTLSTAI